MTDTADNKSVPRQLELELYIAIDDFLIDWICTVAMLGPQTSIRSMARFLDMSVYKVNQVLIVYSGDYIARWSGYEFFDQMYNHRSFVPRKRPERKPTPTRVSKPVEKPVPLPDDPLRARWGRESGHYEV